MTKEDKYWAWTMRAISNDLDSSIKYLYDSSIDSLFSVSITGGKALAHYRNYNATNYELKVIDLAIKKYISSSLDIIELPTIPTQDISKFLKKLYNDVNDNIIQDILISEIECENISFDNIKRKIKSYDKHKLFTFDLLIGEFIVNKIQMLYTPMGITEKSTILC